MERTITVTPIADATADRLRADIEAGHIPAERRDQAGAPCRQCLRPAAEGEAVWLFTYQPFTGPSAYAVPSPIFLHVEPCRAHRPDRVPAFVEHGGLRAVRAYDRHHAIVDGAVVTGGDVATTAATLLADDRAAYVHVHCAVNGCFTLRVDRARTAGDQDFEADAFPPLRPAATF